MRPLNVDSTVEWLLAELEALGDVEPRAMFGGTALYLEGDVFGIVYDGRVYLKVDEASRAAYVDAGSAPFRPRPTQTLKSYYEVPPHVLEDAETLSRWAARALAAARGDTTR